MSYYPGWFDYATWIFILGGVACGASMLPLPAGRRRGLLKLSACTSIALGISFGGTAGLLFNLRAAHIPMHGMVSNVSISHGNRSATTRFYVLGGNHLKKYFEVGRSLPQITVGEEVELTYQDDSNFVLNLAVTKGVHSGFSYSDNDNSFGAIFFLFLALAICLYGVMNFIIDGTGVRSETEDNIPPPSDVDSESLLNL